MATFPDDPICSEKIKIFLIDNMYNKRLQNEVIHGKFLTNHNAGEIWNWESPAGKIRWKRRVIMLTNSLKSGMIVLEIGCGTGLFTKEIAKMPVQLTAIDISPDLIEIARENISDSNVSFFVENAYKLPYDNGIFDAVIGSSVLHHLDIEPALKEFYRVLKPNGYIAFTEPNMMNPQIALQKNIKYLKRKAGDSPDETAFFAWILRKKLEKFGFSGIHISPFDFLHPGIPERWIKFIKPLTDLAEKIPLLKHISGSLFINAWRK